MRKLCVISIVILCIILATASIIYVSNETEQKEISDNNDSNDVIGENGNDNITEPLPELYSDIITISQDNIQLDNEYIQYKILFHDSDTITVNVDMSYSVDTLENLFYVVYLADGMNELTYKTFLRHEPTGKIDISLRKHWKFTSTPSSDTETFDRTFDVRRNDTWYLTIVVYKSMNETITVSIASGNLTMEMSIVERDNTMGYYTVQDGDFSGRFFAKYRGISIFGFGRSRCHVTKSITVEKGTLFYCNIDNFLNAVLLSTPPNDKTYQHASKQRYKIVNENTHYYEGANKTGEWVFSIKATGFLRKSTASLFYVDVNPHGDFNLWG